MTPAEAVVADIREPKRVVVPSEAPPSEPGFTRQLLKDGGEEKVLPPPGRNDESVKLRKSEEEGAEGVLLALVNRRPGWMKDGCDRNEQREERHDTSELYKFPEHTPFDHLESNRNKITKIDILLVQMLSIGSTVSPSSSSSPPLHQFLESAHNAQFLC